MSQNRSKKYISAEVALNRSLAKISSIENLKKGNGIIDSHAQIDLDSVNKSTRNDASKVALHSNASIND